MKVDGATVLCFDASAALLGIELADPAMGGSHSALHVAALFALVILELAAYGSERIAERDVWVFVCMVSRVSMPNRDLLVRQCDVDPEVVQNALMFVVSRRLDDDMTAHDMVAELVESGSELADASFQGRRAVHMTEGDLEWNDHGGLCVAFGLAPGPHASSPARAAPISVASGLTMSFVGMPCM